MILVSDTFTVTPFWYPVLQHRHLHVQVSNWFSAYCFTEIGRKFFGFWFCRDIRNSVYYTSCIWSWVNRKVHNLLAIHSITAKQHLRLFSVQLIWTALLFVLMIYSHDRHFEAFCKVSSQRNTRKQGIYLILSGTYLSIWLDKLEKEK